MFEQEMRVLVDSRKAWRGAVLSIAVAGAASAYVEPTRAQDATASTPTPPQTLDRVEIIGNYDNGVGTSNAASQGSVTTRLIESRPTLRPAEILEFVPGVIISQHSGDGKANQYYLRGFNLDHGTDFATWLDGMPINMPTHAHGHGYSDLNFLIPELVSRIDYRKGPYYADDGDFASAGSARISLLDRLPRGLAQITVGQNGYQRGLLANSRTFDGGADLLYALELGRNDGPWDLPEQLHKVNGVLRYSFGPAAERSSLTAMAYSSHWSSTDQIPLRAVESGLIDRFGNLDPSDGGKTERWSLSYGTRGLTADGNWDFNAYAVASRLNLWSNFTFDLEHPVDLGDLIDGDQFEQAERRKVVGAQASRTWNLQLFGHEVTNRLGGAVRHDRLDPVGLYGTVDRVRWSTTQESTVRQTSSTIWGDSTVQWMPGLRGVLGLRGDRYTFDVKSSIATNSGSTSDSILSPKLALIFGPWNKTEWFVNAGRGFHSNDARGTVATVSAKTGAPVDRVTPLARTTGAELGMRTELIPGLQSSLALWQLRIASELIFVGDAGDTEASRPSKRSGVEWNNHYVYDQHLKFDIDLAASRARFTEYDPVGDHIPGSVNRVVSAGVSLSDLGPWFGQFQLRYFGPRDLVEDGSVKSQATTLAYLRVGYRVDRDLKLMLDVFNLFDKKASDIDYYYASRLPGEPAAGVDDLHFHPVEPRSVRVSLAWSF